MSDSIRVGVAGLTHGHVWGLIDAWKKANDTQLVAVADETPLLEKAAGNFERTYADWRQMLEKEKLDALVVTSNNVESAQIAVEALGAGIPCMVEKAMAANAKDADRMLEAMRKSGKALMINWPIAWSPAIQEFMRLAASGEVGPIFHLRFRNGHPGPKEIGCDQWFVSWLYDEKLNGGGAIADFCCYGAVVARFVLGMPESVFCVKGNYTKDYQVSDDHAICVLKFPKASAVLEGTWATVGMDEGDNPVAHGKTGTVSVKKGEVLMAKQGQDRAVVTPHELEFKSPADYFIACIKSGKKPEGILDPVIAADACRILDAATEANKSGCAVKPG